jgi:predicted DNA-binding transcriptional regulator AlpA
MQPANRFPPLGYSRIADVLSAFPISRTAWYRRIQEGLIPKPLKLGTSSVWSNTYLNALLDEFERCGEFDDACRAAMEAADAGGLAARACGRAASAPHLSLVSNDISLGR